MAHRQAEFLISPHRTLNSIGGRGLNKTSPRPPSLKVFRAVRPANCMTRAKLMFEKEISGSIGAAATGIK
jgi:hypothetical protein